MLCSCCCKNTPDNIPGLHTQALKQQTVLFSFSHSSDGGESFFFIFCFATPLLSLASGTQQTELSLENDDLLHVLKSYLASCLSCNKPNPSTVSTALFRVLGKVLVKDTWAVYSFLISMLSPPSICWKRHIEETLDNNQLWRSTDRPTARSASTYNLDWTMVTS